jgi:uncharacterized protein YciI
MNYYMVEGTFNPASKTESELKELIRLHLEFLEIGFNNGSILFSGSKTERNGGYIIMKAESDELLREYLHRDPFITSGFQEGYKITQYLFHKAQPEAMEWFTN